MISIIFVFWCLKMSFLQKKSCEIALFFQNIWSYQKKAVPLHSLSTRRSDITNWCGSSVGQNTCLSRMGSRVRVSSAPQGRCKCIFFCFSYTRPTCLSHKKKMKATLIGGFHPIFILFKVLSMSLTNIRRTSLPQRYLRAHLESEDT